MRKREEADFYKTIERDLTLALEEERRSSSQPGPSTSEGSLSSQTAGAKQAVQRGKMMVDGEGELSFARRHRLRRRREGSISHDEDDDAAAADSDDEDDEEYADEPEEEEGGVDDENERGRLRPGRSRGGEEGDQGESDTFSDLDDDEINSLLLTKEEAEKKKILWEKMNADYIREQEEKRLMGLNQPEAPKRKRKKKLPDANAPPPDTAQHAIYKLKSRRINYEVIDELFGEAASNGY
ncbi:hypothetical protein PINS_up019348 [Pythium insidiosum]|nr:hypothetical protein PINS_up019348 [Pythium insidiosum]